MGLWGTMGAEQFDSLYKLHVFMIKRFTILNPLDRSTMMTANACWWPGRPGLSKFQENAKRDPVILRAWLTQGFLSFALSN